MTRFLIAILCALLAPAAHAQETPTIASVVAGWDDTLPVDAWAPITVDVLAGTELASGAITISVSQYGERVARFRRPFASAMGVRASYEIPVRLSSSTRYYGASGWEFEIALESPRGRAFDTWRSDDSTRSDGSIVVDTAVTRASEVLLVTTPSSPAFAMPSTVQPVRSRSWDDKEGDSEAESAFITRWFQLSLRDVRADALPQRARTLESAAVIVLHTQTLQELNPGRRDALLGWVREGGRLLVIGDRLAIDRDFLPRDVDPTSDALTTESGASLARERWPVGLGVLAHLPEQPADLAIDANERMGLWLDLFEMPEVDRDRWWYATPVNRAESRALDGVVDRFNGIEPPPVWWLFLFVGLIAVCTGPLDRFIMKRLRLLHRSWASALGWIALASAGAIIIPTIITGGSSHAGRMLRVDVAPDGTPFVDATVALYATSAHRARTVAQGDSVGRWQHVLGERDSFQSFFTPVISVGDGAALPSVSMRPRSLFAYREASGRVGPDISAELRTDDNGEQLLIVRSERPFTVAAIGLWTEDGVSAASLNNGAPSSTPVTSFEARFPFPAQNPTSYFEDGVFDEPGARQRTETMAFIVEQGATAYACVSLIFPESEPIAGAPPDAKIAREHVRARIPVAVTPPKATETTP